MWRFRFLALVVMCLSRLAEPATLIYDPVSGEFSVLQLHRIGGGNPLTPQGLVVVSHQRDARSLSSSTRHTEFMVREGISGRAPLLPGHVQSVGGGEEFILQSAAYLNKDFMVFGGQVQNYWNGSVVENPKPPEKKSRGWLYPEDWFPRRASSEPPTVTHWHHSYSVPAVFFVGRPGSTQGALPPSGFFKLFSFEESSYESKPLALLPVGDEGAPNGILVAGTHQRRHPIDWSQPHQNAMANEVSSDTAYFLGQWSIVAPINNNNAFFSQPTVVPVGQYPLEFDGAKPRDARLLSLSLARSDGRYYVAGLVYESRSHRQTFFLDALESPAEGSALRLVHRHFVVLSTHFDGSHYSVALDPRGGLGTVLRKNHFDGLEVARFSLAKPSSSLVFASFPESVHLASADFPHNLAINGTFVSVLAKDGFSEGGHQVIQFKAGETEGSPNYESIVLPKSTLSADAGKLSRACHQTLLGSSVASIHP